ncbi:MAG: hypothetical protein GQ569_07915, partial [Methylococcaceae bacterium]|nr:hypothetical protein [Methylococcaceae bacterium]
MVQISFWKIFPTFLAAILLVACSSDPVAPPPLEFNITAEHKANDNRLFYFVVRNTNEKQFMLESYQEIANKAFSKEPDPAMLGVFSVVPGVKQVYTIDPPTQGALALYFLFTQPGMQWKKLLTLP